MGRTGAETGLRTGGEGEEADRLVDGGEGECTGL